MRNLQQKRGGLSPAAGSGFSLVQMPLDKGNRRAFTLIELLVVIGVLMVLMGILIPNLAVLTMEVESGINVLSVATATARSVAGAGVPVGTGFYSGSALLAGPGGDLRIVLERDPDTFVDPVSLPLPTTMSAYTDVQDHDYARLPRGVGMAGWAGAGSGGGLRLLAAPFVLRFDSDRRLIWREPSAEDGLLYYNGNGDQAAGKEVITAGRDRTTPWYTSSGGLYDPDDWDQDAPDYQAWDDTSANPGFHPTLHKPKLPFDAYESVVGVIVYSKKKLRAAGKSLISEATAGRPINSDGTAWLVENGKLLLFNRYTGTVSKQP